MALKIGNVTVTRHKHYNEVKHYIANLVLLFNEYIVPSAISLSEDLHISDSSVSRVYLQLASEDFPWIEKVDKGSSRNSYYKIIADREQCEQYMKYLSLPRRKKRKFKKMVKQVGQKAKAGQKSEWAFGTKEGAKVYASYQAEYGKV